MHRSISGLAITTLLLLGACDDEICIDGECFSPDPEADVELAAWLDWTTLPSPFGATWSAESWWDRSGRGHHASVGELSRVPLQAIGDTNVLHFHGDHNMSLAQEEGDALWTLEEEDYLITMATSLDCFPGEPASDRHGVFEKFRPAAEWPEAGAGPTFDVDEPVDGVHPIRAIVMACKPYYDGCYTALRHDETPATCGGDFQLFTLRRFTADGQSQVEARIDGASLGPAAAPPGNTGGGVLEFDSIGTPLRGRAAALVAVKGNVDDAQTCQLEQFLLERLHAAGLRESAPDLGCPEA
jgi:hypothetical protein